jgi:hypothetical protein
MTLASTTPGLLWAIASDRVTTVRASGGQWTELARLAAPAYTVPSLGLVRDDALVQFGAASAVGMSIEAMARQLAEAFGGDYAARAVNGTHALCDVDNVLFANFGFGLYAFGLVDAAEPSRGIAVLRRLEDLRALTGAETPEQLVGLSLTYDGHLVVVLGSSLVVLDRTLDPTSAVRHSFGDERVSSSVAVDERGGLYVATHRRLHKLVWTGARLTDLEVEGAWSSPYESTEELPPVPKRDRGAGAAPTLLGFGDDPDKLVVLTDGQRRMHLVAFWRDAIPDWFIQRPNTVSRRIAGQLPVTLGLPSPPEWLQTTHSVVVRGTGALVVNGLSADPAALLGQRDDRLLVGTLLGPAVESSTGVQRFVWNTSYHEWVPVWARPDVAAANLAPLHSRARNLVLVHGYAPGRGWEVTGLDWETGQTRHQTLLGRQNLGNGAGGLLQVLDTGELLLNSIVGALRVRSPAPGTAP